MIVNMNQTPRQLLTRATVAAKWNVPFRTVDAWIRAGQLPHICLPNDMVRIDPADAAAFVEQFTAPAARPAGVSGVGGQELGI